jgi:hypothetical protein
MMSGGDPCTLIKLSKNAAGGGDLNGIGELFNRDSFESSELPCNLRGVFGVFEAGLLC